MELDEKRAEEQQMTYLKAIRESGLAPLHLAAR